MKPFDILKVKNASVNLCTILWITPFAVLLIGVMLNNIRLMLTCLILVLFLLQ